MSEKTRIPPETQKVIKVDVGQRSFGENEFLIIEGFLSLLAKTGLLVERALVKAFSDGISMTVTNAFVSPVFFKREGCLDRWRQL